MTDRKVSSMRVVIDALAGGGEGVAHAFGCAVFVPKTAPGDEVEVEARRKDRGLVRARLIRVIREGRDRVEPACPRALLCGGCMWQQVAYAAQIKAKETLLERALKGAKLLVDPEPFLPAAGMFEYRRRARLRWTVRGSSVALGFFGPRTHRVVDAVSRQPICPVLQEPAQAALHRLRSMMEDPRWPPRGEVNLLVSGDGEVHLGLSVEPDESREKAMRGSEGKLVEAAESMVEQRVALGVIVKGRRKQTSVGSDRVNLNRPPDPPVFSAAHLFAQTNAEMDRFVGQRLVDCIGAPQGEILELYAGTGNLTWRLGRLAPVTAVEKERESARLLDAACQGFDGHHVNVLHEDALTSVRSIVRAGRRFDVVVMDPPRTGCKDLVREMEALRPNRIVYVSCDAMTLARDMSELKRCGFEVLRVGGIDTMPHTSHFEIVALLERR